VLPDNAVFNGELIDVFTLFRGAKNEKGTRGTNIAAIRSADHGATWTKQEVIISDFRRGIVADPDDGAAHRTGDINPEAAVDPGSGAVYVVWQDRRFGPRSSIALSRSLDGGLTWSSPIKVNQTPPADPGEPTGNNQAFTRWCKC
jgi:Neuraminidase (sialidase)